MDDNGRIAGTEGPATGGAAPPDGEADARPPAARPGPTWRAWFLSILAAIVLSAAATLLLGGSFRLPRASNGASAASSVHGPCCPLGRDGGK